MDRLSITGTSRRSPAPTTERLLQHFVSPPTAASLTTVSFSKTSLEISTGSWQLRTCTYLYGPVRTHGLPDLLGDMILHTSIFTSRERYDIGNATAAKKYGIRHASPLKSREGQQRERKRNGAESPAPTIERLLQLFVSPFTTISLTTVSFSNTSLGISTGSWQLPQSPSSKYSDLFGP
uniref:Uncharacterized protein n=1 Tax=Steinernema glaseri TaxID=37863 RepID=A0A1I8ATI4_9BILA